MQGLGRNALEAEVSQDSVAVAWLVRVRELETRAAPVRAQAVSVACATFWAQVAVDELAVASAAALVVDTVLDAHEGGCERRCSVG